MFVTEQYLQEVFGTGFVAGMSPDSNAVSKHIQLGSAMVESALAIAGYTVGGVAVTASDTYGDIDGVPLQIKLAAVGGWWTAAHIARGIPVPSGASIPENVRPFVEAFAKLEAGTLVVVGGSPELTRSTSRGPAGVAFTESDPDVEGSRPAVFARERMGDY